jgi:hypothetical protein
MQIKKQANITPTIKNTRFNIYLTFIKLTRALPRSDTTRVHDEKANRIVPGLLHAGADQGSIAVHARAAHRLHSCRAGSNPERGAKIKRKN